MSVEFSDAMEAKRRRIAEDGDATTSVTSK